VLVSEATIFPVQRRTLASLVLLGGIAADFIGLSYLMLVRGLCEGPSCSEHTTGIVLCAAGLVVLVVALIAVRRP
jgi:hypothetical protein